MEAKPSFSEFKLMTKMGNLIPVYQEFLGDTETPVSAYMKIRDKSFFYLLESADEGIGGVVSVGDFIRSLR